MTDLSTLPNPQRLTFKRSLLQLWKGTLFAGAFCLSLLVVEVLGDKIPVAQSDGKQITSLPVSFWISLYLAGMAWAIHHYLIAPSIQLGHLVGSAQDFLKVVRTTIKNTLPYSALIAVGLLIQLMIADLGPPRTEYWMTLISFLLLIGLYHIAKMQFEPWYQTHYGHVGAKGD